MKPYLDRAAFHLICGSLVSILFSIAASQILLGLALAALLLSSEPLRLPPIKLPLALFLAGTVISWLASGHIHDGTPQIRKFFVFTVLLVVYSTFRKISEIRAIALIWAGVATLSAIRSLFQFGQKYADSQQLHRNFYEFYIGSRITGFMSHWMTFGGEEMIVLLFLLALLFFSIERRWKAMGWFCAFVLGISLVLGFTRSIFLLGFPVGLVYLLWFWHQMAGGRCSSGCRNRIPGSAGGFEGTRDVHHAAARPDGFQHAPQHYPADGPGDDPRASAAGIRSRGDERSGAV